MKIPEITSAKRYHALHQLITEAASQAPKKNCTVVSKSVPKILGVSRASIAVVVSDQEFEIVALAGTGIPVWRTRSTGWHRYSMGPGAETVQRLAQKILDFRDCRSSKRLGLSHFIISPMTTARGPIGTFNIGLPEGVPIPDDLAEVAQTVAKILASHLELHTNIEKLERTVQQLSNAQDQLVEQAKNAALGEMLSGLAHEVNTPLSVVGNAISLASDSIDSVSSMMLEGRLTRDGFKSWKTETDHFLDLGRQNLGRAIRIMTELKSVSLEHHLDARDPVNLQDLVGA